MKKLCCYRKMVSYRNMVIGRHSKWRKTLARSLKYIDFLLKNQRIESAEGNVCDHNEECFPVELNTLWNGA